MTWSTTAPEPAACVGWAIEQASSSIFIQGNHDWGVAWKRDPRSSPSYRHFSEVTQAFSIQALSAGALNFLRTLEAVSAFRLAGWRFFACHAAPSDPLFRYLPRDEKKLREEVIIAQNPDFIFLGHTHIPFIKFVGNTVVVNPGSVGQPKDGDPRAAYAVWENGKTELRRTAYSIEDTARAYATSSLAASDIENLIAVPLTGGMVRSIKD